MPSRFTRRKAVIAEMESLMAEHFSRPMRIYRWLLLTAYNFVQRRLARAQSYKQMKKWHTPDAWIEERLIATSPPGRRRTFQAIVRKHGLTLTERRWLWRSMLRGTG